MLHNIINIYHKFGTWLVLFLWTGGIILLISLYSIGSIPPKYIYPSVLAWVAFIIFLIWDRLTKNKDEDVYNHITCQNQLLSRWVLSERWERILTIIFFIGVTITLFIIQCYEERPLFYFVLCSILAGILTITILFSPKQISSTVQLMKIGVLSSLTTFSFFKIYFWTGNDTWYHVAANELVVLIGNLYGSIGKEVDYPLQHIFVPAVDLISAVDVRIASVLAIAIPSLLLSVVVYIITRKVIGERFALIACLLTNLSVHLIEWRILSQTTSYGILVFFILFMLYFSIIFTENKILQRRFVILYFISLIALCLGHQFTAFMVIFVLLGGYGGSVLFHKSLINKELWLLVSSVFIMFIVWLVASYGFNTMISIILGRFSVTSGGILEGYDIEPYVNIAPPSELSALLNTPEFFIFICLLPIIFLSVKYAHSTDKHHKTLHILAISFGFVFCAYFLSTLIGGGMSARFLPILAIYASICISYLLWHITIKLSKQKKYINKILIGISIFIIVFSMVNLPCDKIAPDNPIYVKGAVLQSSISIGDLNGMKTLSEYYPRDVVIYSDNYNILRCLSYTTFLNRYNSQHVIPEIKNVGILANWNFIHNQTGSHLILRDDLYSTPAYNRVYYHTGIYTDQQIQLTEHYIDNLIDNNDVIYINGDILSLIIK